jgi:hypothetical protein
MCANSTGRAQVFLSASDAAVSQDVADGRIGIQSACAPNTRYMAYLISCQQLTLYVVLSEL